MQMNGLEGSLFTARHAWRTFAEGKEIPEGSLVIGNGNIAKQLSEKHMEMLKMGANHYVKNQAWFKEVLKLVVEDDDAPQSKL